MKKLYEKEMPLLHRKRVAFELTHPNKATPSRAQLKQDIAKHIKSKENLIAIRHIFTKYGAGHSKVIAHVYDDENIKNKLDPLKKKEQKKAKKEEPKKEPAPKTEEQPKAKIETKEKK